MEVIERSPYPCLIGLRAEDIWRVLADCGECTAEHIAAQTCSDLGGVVSYLRDDLHHERVGAIKLPDGSDVYALQPRGVEALRHAESFSLLLDVLDDAVQPMQPWSLADALGEELEFVAALVDGGRFGSWVEVSEDGGLVISERGRRKLEVDRVTGRIAPSL